MERSSRGLPGGFTHSLSGISRLRYPINNMGSNLVKGTGWRDLGGQTNQAEKSPRVSPGAISLLLLPGVKPICCSPVITGANIWLPGQCLEPLARDAHRDGCTRRHSPKHDHTSQNVPRSPPSVRKLGLGVVGRG